jgi:hypothetical protein
MNKATVILVLTIALWVVLLWGSVAVYDVVKQ